MFPRYYFYMNIVMLSEYKPYIDVLPVVRELRFSQISSKFQRNILFCYYQ